MNTENDFASRNDEVVFENRNRAYGAYSIRKSYQLNLSKGSVTCLMLVTLVFAGVQIAKMLKPGAVVTSPKQHEGGIILDYFPLPEPQPKKELRPRLKTTNANFPPRAVSKPVDNPTPPVENPTSSSNGNTQGPAVDVPSPGPGTEVPQTPVIVEPPKTVDIAEIMPEFEGGTKALYKFLKKTLRYPKAAERTHDKGTVYVRFIIDVNGEVTGVEIARGATKVLDNEASRVIGLMPRWRPGTQHGMPVNVRMIMPIKFEMPEE